MNRAITTDGVVLAKVMRDHLNNWNKKPANFQLENLDKDAPSISLQQLSSAEKKRTYINGSYVGVWHFAIYLRIDATDTASRFDAIGCLEDLSLWLQARDEKGAYSNLPEIDSNRTATQIEMTTTPSIAAKYDDGIEDYQALFTLEYQSRRI